MDTLGKFGNWAKEETTLMDQLLKFASGGVVFVTFGFGNHGATGSWTFYQIRRWLSAQPLRLDWKLETIEAFVGRSAFFNVDRSNTPAMADRS
ncbi:hypothetical protein CT0861_05232 [Colletotrichum tofieldiae]|uniref:Uncharacterized protein n=1 Tax=Colletotrichum tofieldiae TaxID=708197 RepID=A0A166WRA4_9PEZI|nr:hypothetical protein CT0861_05232 [Colletotrichum tofieldiae]